MPRAPGGTSRPPPRAGGDAGARVLRENPRGPLSPGPCGSSARSVSAVGPAAAWGASVPPSSQCFQLVLPRPSPQSPRGPSLRPVSARLRTLSFPPLSVISRGSDEVFAGAPVGFSDLPPLRVSDGFLAGPLSASWGWRVTDSLRLTLSEVSGFPGVQGDPGWQPSHLPCCAPFRRRRSRLPGLRPLPVSLSGHLGRCA